MLPGCFLVRAVQVPDQGVVVDEGRGRGDDLP